MKTPLVALVLLSLVATTSFADRPAHERSHKEERGHKAHRDVTNVTRTETRTNAAGETASRTTTIHRDPDTKTVNRETNGQRFDGKTYSGTDVREKTDTGYTRKTTRTNAEGETTSRDVNATVDKEAGKITKDITVVDKEGETHTRSVEKTRTRGNE